MKSVVALIRPFKAVAKEISAGQYPTISKLILLVRSLQQMSASTGSNNNIKLGDELFLEMRRQFLTLNLIKCWQSLLCWILH